MVLLKEDQYVSKLNYFKRAHALVKRCMIYGLLPQQALFFVPANVSQERPAGTGPFKKKNNQAVKKRKASAVKRSSSAVKTKGKQDQNPVPVPRLQKHERVSRPTVAYRRNFDSLSDYVCKYH